jgi:hypothetical protein
MHGMCLDANRDASNRAAVILAPCRETSSQIWQFR